MKKFIWQHIEFADGSNPYICRTEREFNHMREKYVLKPVKDGFWLAVGKSEPEILWEGLF